MKKYFKSWVVLLAILLLMRELPFNPVSLAAETSSTWQKIDEVNREKDELENKLDAQQDDINGLKGEKKTLQGELNTLNGQLTEIGERLQELEEQIRDKEQEIADTQEALAEAVETEEWQYQCMVIRVQSMYESSDVSYVNALLTADSFSDILNVADWFEEIADYDQKKLAEFKETRQLVEETQARLQSEKIELDNLKVSAEAEKNKVAGLISQTAGSISRYADQIEDAERKALEYEAEIKKKEEDLEYLRKKLEEEMAMSQAAANATWRDISEVDFAEGDRRLLANLIYCEAGGEEYEGQLAVGSVVINRVLSSKYPDTVVGVIYQKSQFSPVGSGRLDLALTYDKATASCYKAADEAMSGVTNVGNCVYFRTPIDGLTGIRIGGHIFY